MANIIDKIVQIRQAIFGKDVRESIASGIENINAEVESTTKKQELLEIEFDQMVINAGNSNAEIVQARVDESGKTYVNLQERMNTVDSSLAHIVYKISSNDIDDTLELQKAIDTYNSIELITDLIVTSELKINRPIRIFSKDYKKITLTVNTLLDIINVNSSNVTIRTIKIDCSNKANTGIKINGNLKNVDISENEILNCYQTNTSEVAGILLLTDGCENIKIKNNYVHDCVAVGNGIESDANGVSRGIMLFGETIESKNIEVKENIIENISPYEDADGIAFISSNNDYKISLTVSNNKIVNAKKRGIKINPCVGNIIIEKNEIIQTDLTNRMYSGISVYSKNAKVRDNILNVKYAWFGIEVEPRVADSINVENNTIYLYNGSYIDSINVRGINISGLIDILNIKNNEIDGGYASIILKTNVSNKLHVEGNVFTNVIYANLYVYGGITAAQLIKNLIFNNNKMAGNAGVYFTEVSGLAVNNVICVGNTGITNWGIALDLNTNVQFTDIQISNNAGLQTKTRTDIVILNNAKGIILTDRINGKQYRLKIENGVFGVEVI